MSDPAADIKAFDFTKPCKLPPTVEHIAQEWQRGIANFASELWNPYLPYSTKWARAAPQTVRPFDEGLPGPLVNYHVRHDDAERTTLLSFPQTLALAIVEGVLGGTLEELPDARRLTTIELGMLEVMVERLVQAINEASDQLELAPVTYDRHERRAKLSRLFPSDQDLAMLAFKVTGPFGDAQMYWIWPQDMLEEMFDEPESLKIHDVKTGLLDVAKQIPLEVCIRLGTKQVNVTEIANLKPGDVLLLDHDVAEPVHGYVREDLMFEGWPGVVGSRHAFKIASLRGG